jgi:hypothetical protein
MTMRKFLPFLALVVLIGLLGCTAKPAAKRPTAARFRILDEANKVEVFRLDPNDGPYNKKPKLPGQTRIGGYLVTAQGSDQGRDFAAKLAEILSDDATSTDEFVKCYDPGVAFRASHDGETLDIIICYMCENLYYGPPTDHADENLAFHGSPRRADLVRLAKQAFPNDAEIQGLKE